MEEIIVYRALKETAFKSILASNHFTAKKVQNSATDCTLPNSQIRLTNADLM